MTFSVFYQQGGLFMHLVTLTALAGVVSVARRAIAVRRTISAPHGAQPPEGGVTPWLVVAGMFLGTLGTLFGFGEASAALETVPSEMWGAALLRVGQIVFNPLMWSLMTLTPVVLAHATLLHFERRVGRALRNADRIQGDPTAA